jgi:hypothetical protein|tara:strand:- start:234 stop:440 length:207 start_codon:yes stop_codon:yes gene_type:complete
MEKRVEGFFEARCRELENENKSLQFDNAEMKTQSDILTERIQKMSMRQPNRAQKSFNNKTQRQFTSNK